MRQSPSDSLSSDSPISDPPSRVLAAPVLAAAAIAAWTLFVWSNRISNVLDDDELAGWAMTWRLAVAVVFVVLALVSAFAAASSRAALTLPTWGTGAVSALAMASILWWPPRTVSTLVADFSVAFKVVHVVLAVVSVGLGVWALRTVRAGSSRFPAAKG